MNKTTSRELYNRIINAMPNDAEVVAFCQKQITAMDKRNEKRKASTKPTKAQEARAELVPLVLAALTDEPMSVKEIADKVGVIYQKVTPALGDLVEANKAYTVKEKGKTKYALAEA